MRMGKKLSSKNESVKDQLIEQYKLTIEELLNKVKTLEKEIKQLRRR